jgi:ATP-dependent Lon protease
VSFFRCPRMQEEPTTVIIQRYLDALAGDPAADSLIRVLLERAAGRLHRLCANLLHRRYPRLTRPPTNLETDDLLGSVVARLLTAMREVRPQSVRQFFALASQHMRWQLNDLARRLDEYPACAALAESGIANPPSSLGSCLTPDGQRMVGVIEGLPETEREVFDLVLIQGLTRTEVADVVGVSVKTVQRRLNRARLLLADQLSDLRPAGPGGFPDLYVSEYLIAKFVKPETWRQHLERIQAKIKESLPDLEHRELLKDRLLRTGEVIVIDFLEARVDLRGQQRWVKVPALNDDRVRASAAILEQHPGLMLGGMWGTAKVKYAPELDPEAPLELLGFTPFQIGQPSLDEWRDKRGQFTLDEWIALLLHSSGYADAAFPTRRVKFLLLARLIPLVERNVNMVELGPRQTGKTFLLRNVSPRVFTVSGGRTTPANLFVNLNTRAVGILGTRKVVVFDEIAHTSFGEEDATISTLKDYMESGQFSRGAKTYATDASLVYAGNLDVDGSLPHPRYRHLFEPLPDELIDSAFLDRIHGYLPGWEMPKITPGSLAQGVGFVTDFFGEILVKLRDEDFQAQARRVTLTRDITRRDQVAVERMTSGLMKLLYPDKSATGEQVAEVVALACELRQRVHHQLCEIAPGEFRPRIIGFEGMPTHEAPDLRPRHSGQVPADDTLNRTAAVGAVTGLVVIHRDDQPVGGDIVIIQVAALHGSAGVEVTGLHGSVLKDSVQTAYNVVRRNYREFEISEQRFKEQKVAVHLVRIAEARDGPSAGLAFVVGIVSALTNRAVKPGCAFIGEVTLFGEVKDVGGVPMKVKAAHRAGRTVVYLPADNGRDIQGLDDDVLGKVTIIPVRTVKEVLDQVLVPGS